MKTTRQWEYWGFGLIGLAFLLRLLVILSAPVDLSGDESYYWEWGRRLDWGYISKPPLIGWLMGLSGWLFGNSEWGVRIMALLFGTGSLLMLLLLTHRLFNPEVAFWGVLASLLAPGNAAANLIFTIDAPLVFFWTLALYASWRYVADEKQRGRWGWVLGMALAAGYLSKQMMLVFPFLWLLWLITEPAQRKILKAPSTWLVLVLPLLALLPPLLWNARENWITFQHTGGHFGSKAFTVFRSLGWFGEFVGSQLALISPVIWTLLLVALWSVFRNWKKSAPAFRFLWVFSAPALGVFVLLSLRQRILPNWPAVFYVAGICLLTGWVFGCGQNWPYRSGKVFRAGLWVGGGLVFIMYSLLYMSPLLSLERDPLERIRGWEAYGNEIAKVDQAIWPKRESAAAKRILYVVGHRYFASELAFYHPEQPQVFLYDPPGEIHSQYGLWEDVKERKAGEALIIMDAHKTDKLPDAVLSQWAEVEELAPLQIPVTKNNNRLFRLFHASGFIE